jgi:hypothetical protein
VNQRLSPPNTVILAAGGVMLIGSFLDFYSYSSSAGSASFNAWSGGRGFGIFGIVTVAVLCGIVMAAEVAITAFANGVNVPDQVLGLSWDQIHLALGFQAALMMLAFLARSKGPLAFGTLSFGIGFWLMLLAGIALLAGAIMRVRGAGT